MQKTFKFPDVGEGIAEGEIVRWLISEGDMIKEDEPILEIETDKAVVSLPSPYTGKILSRQGNPGDIIPVGAVLITVEIEEEADFKKAVPSEKTSGKKKDAGSVVGQIEESEEEFVIRPVPINPDPPGTKRIRAIPSVRRYAKERGLDLTKIRGTGKEGRITREDVQREAATSPLGPSERVPFRGVRRSAAKRVTASTQHVAAVTFVDDADITALERVRSNKKEMAEEKGFKLTSLPFIIKSVVAGLKEYPYLNAMLDEENEEILLRKYYNIGIAVDTPQGLMVFVIKKADEKSILELAKEISILTEKAFSRTIDLSELKGGSFTLTNYGVIGGIYGTPIINYPEAGILGLGKIEDRAVVRSGEIVIRKILPLSLTFDHRIIYGAEAARFMNTVIKHLEDPDLMLIEGK
ncbi:MAG: dihydrolipoamide acetyltransferase family protein [Nitrospira sp.]|nr:2-oxo acid dehydrogenase subunit E2 [Candidatus Manganitrophaceae bacterium]HIL34953.1 2-oxo acid dehydrogenase subunit E2 [Candidatus Manganitrophaceae bacterium]